MANVPTSFWCYAPMTVNGTRALNYPASVNARTRTFTYEMPHGTVEDPDYTTVNRNQTKYHLYATELSSNISGRFYRFIVDFRDEI